MYLNSGLVDLDGTKNVLVPEKDYVCVYPALLGYCTLHRYYYERLTDDTVTTGTRTVRLKGG